MSVVSNTIRYVGVGALILVGLLVILAIYVYATSPALPANANTIIDSVMGLALPERVRRQAGYVTSGGYQIWYESIQPCQQGKGNNIIMQRVSHGRPYVAASIY